MVMQQGKTKLMPMVPSKYSLNLNYYTLVESLVHVNTLSLLISKQLYHSRALGRTMFDAVVFLDHALESRLTALVVVFYLLRSVFYPLRSVVRSWFYSCHSPGEGLKHHVLSVCACEVTESEETIINTAIAGFIVMYVNNLHSTICVSR